MSDQSYERGLCQGRLEGYADRRQESKEISRLRAKLERARETQEAALCECITMKGKNYICVRCRTLRELETGGGYELGYSRGLEDCADDLDASREEATDIFKCLATPLGNAIGVLRQCRDFELADRLKKQYDRIRKHLGGDSDE